MIVGNPEIQGQSIVLIGDFNPRIFQPAWFGKEHLIRENEADTATIKIIHPDIVSFSTEWFELDITRDRFTISTNHEAFYEFLRDLVIGTFKILKHTPLKYFGINNNRHFRIRSENEWHKIGDSLAPKHYWKRAFERPGMRSLTIEESIRPDGFKGYIRVTVEPSVKINPGVFFQVNDHFTANNIDSVLGSDEIIDIFQSVWKVSLQRSSNIINSVLEAL